MPLTLDQIVAEASRWPREEVAELVDRLSLTLQGTVEPAIDQAWKEEARRRLAELESGGVRAIPGEEVSERIRRIVRR